MTELHNRIDEEVSSWQAKQSTAIPPPTPNSDFKEVKEAVSKVVMAMTLMLHRDVHSRDKATVAQVN